MPTSSSPSSNVQDEWGSFIRRPPPPLHSIAEQIANNDAAQIVSHTLTSGRQSELTQEAIEEDADCGRVKKTCPSRRSESHWPVAYPWKNLSSPCPRKRADPAEQWTRRPLRTARNGSDPLHSAKERFGQGRENGATTRRPWSSASAGPPAASFQLSTNTHALPPVAKGSACEASLKHSFNLTNIFCY